MKTQSIKQLIKEVRKAFITDLHHELEFLYMELSRMGRNNDVTKTFIRIYERELTNRRIKAIVG